MENPQALLDYFANTALSARLRAYESRLPLYEIIDTIAIECYDIAEKMLKERERRAKCQD